MHLTLSYLTDIITIIIDGVFILLTHISDIRKKVRNNNQQYSISRGRISGNQDGRPIIIGFVKVNK